MGVSGSGRKARGAPVAGVVVVMLLAALLPGPGSAGSATSDEASAHVTVAKQCPNGKASSDDRFSVLLDGTPKATVDCGESTDVDVAVGVAYNIDEERASGMNLANYTKELSPGCSGTFGHPGDSAQCTITNTLKPKPVVSVAKVCPHGKAATTDRFAVLVDGTRSGAVLDCGGSAEIELEPGPHVITEDAGSPTTVLADYEREFSEGCVGSIGRGETAECTITNSLKSTPKAHVTVTKDCPGGKFAETDRFEITNQQRPTGAILDCHTATEIELEPETPYSLDEIGTGTPPADLDNYTKTLSAGCSGLLHPGDTADCVITNTLTGTLEVVKSLAPTGDAGRFNLQIDAVTRATNVGNGGTTGPVSVESGGHSVGETAGSATSLGDYTAAIDCSVAGISIAKGTGFGPLSVNVASGAHVVCTITNTRTTTPPPPPPSPPPPPVTPTGTIEVVKSLAPGSDAGRFDLRIDGVTKASGVGNGGSTGKVTVATGAHSVGELAAAGTSLGEYTSSVQCRQDSTVLSSGGGTGLSVAVTQNANVVCTITNVRKAVDIQITKRVSAASVHVGDRITYTLVVTNNGPGTATGVTVSDPLPAEIDFVSVTTTQGSCSGGRVVSCDLGTIPAGGSVTITVVGTAATSARPATNRAVTAASEPESNTANNSATAAIDILGVILPPTCFRTSVAKPKQLKVHTRATIVVTVTERGKRVAGVKVRIRGARLDKTGVTDKYGVARITVTPPTTGIVQVTVRNHRSCNRPQVGVIPVFTPIVSG